MMRRFHFDLGGVKTGPSLSSISIAPEWRGAPPPAAPVEIIAAKGCDVSPIDLNDPARAAMLRAYVWPEASARMARLDQAIAMAEQAPPELEQRDALAFVAAMLAAPPQQGVTRVLFHTVMWQYLPEATRAAIRAAMAAAGEEASKDAPLAWIMSETNRDTFRQECRVRYWPENTRGGTDWVKLTESHPHGDWVEWTA